jgi:hypothetical protein
VPTALGAPAERDVQCRLGVEPAHGRRRRSSARPSLRSVSWLPLNPPAGAPHRAPCRHETAGCQPLICRPRPAFGPVPCDRASGRARRPLPSVANPRAIARPAIDLSAGRVPAGSSHRAVAVVVSKRRPGGRLGQAPCGAAVRVCAEADTATNTIAPPSQNQCPLRGFLLMVNRFGNAAGDIRAALRRCSGQGWDHRAVLPLFVAKCL